MNRKVSQESALLIAAATTLGGGMLAKLGGKVVDVLKSKVGDQAAGKVISQAKASLGSVGEGSVDLVRFTQSARVEPIMLMDKRCVNVPFIQDVVHSLYNRFTGYWLLAISLDTTVSGVKVARKLDKFATDRDLGAQTMTMLGMESIDVSMEGFGLPFVKEIVEEQYRASMEAVDDADMGVHGRIADILIAIDAVEDTKTREQMQEDVKEMQELVEKKSNAQVAGQVNKKVEQQFEKMNEAFNKRYKEVEAYQKTLEAREEQLRAPAKMGVNKASQYVDKVHNLAVGNVIDVTISENGQEATVPVTIRLRVAAAASDVMTQIMAVSGKDNVLLSRWRAWRAGEIKFWADFVLAMDRVDAHRAAMMKDESGYYKAVHSRNSNNKMVQMAGGGASLGTASSILVMDVKTAKELERKVNGRLEHFKTRQAIFGDTFSMLMAVVDPEWESITIYTRGIEMPETLTARDMKVGGGGGTDSKELMDILKSYSLGNTPGRF